MMKTVRKQLIRITAVAARHPKRTTHVAKSGTRVALTARGLKSNPDAQRHVRRSSRAAGHALKRVRKIGGDRARSDARVLADLQKAVKEMSTAFAIAQPRRRERHRVRRIAFGAVLVTGATYGGYRLSRRSRSAQMASVDLGQPNTGDEEVRGADPERTPTV